MHLWCRFPTIFAWFGAAFLMYLSSNFWQRKWKSKVSSAATASTWANKAAQKQTMLQGCKLQISQFFQILTDLGCDGVRSYAPIVAGWFLRLVWNNEWRYLPIGNIKNNGGEYSWKYCILVLEKCSLLVVSEESNCCIHWGLNAQPSVVHQFSLHLRCEWSLTSASALSWNLWQKQHPPPSGMERKALPLHLFQCHLNWSKILAQQ